MNMIFDPAPGPVTEAPLWVPSSDRIEQSNLTAFIQKAAADTGKTFEDWRALHRWSVSAPAEFWNTLWDFAGIISSRRGEPVVENFDSIREARWYSAARLNYAQNMLRKRGADTALVSVAESGARREISYGELFRAVAELAAALTAEGVREGDRVAAYIPNIPEAVVGMLASASIGAVWSSCSPDFGFEGVMDRFGQIEPKVLLCADGYLYKGKRFDNVETAERISRQIQSISTTVVVPYTREEAALPAARGFTTYHDFVDQHRGASLNFKQLPFNHPLYILYSSGTTGKPKCIVHGHGGVLLEHAKELLLHTDLKERDTFFYQTTCGWMMWNWLVSGLLAGSKLVLYEGFPFHPGPARLIDLIDQERITIFGTSARYLAALEKAGVQPASSHSLSSLRTMLSTGSTLLPEQFNYVYQSIKPDLHLASISGGTDIVGCFAAGNPTAPVFRGELQTPCLGKKVEIFDESGTPLRGEPGELVCLAPFPSMPVMFWNDPGGAKYKAAYFEHFPDVWRHGDWAKITQHAGIVIYGRSDATLNPGGVRIGTAEIYRQVEQLPEVTECIAVGQPWEGDQRVVLFVKLQEGIELTKKLQDEIRARIRTGASPRHVPQLIIQAPDLPRTRSGKLIELAISSLLQGREIKNLEAIANPESLQFFRDLRLSPD